MPVSKEEFNKVEVHDKFYGFDMFRTPTVANIAEKAGQRILSIEWEKGNPIQCIWDEVAQKVVTADGSENHDVEGLNGKYGALKPENVSILCQKWLDSGKLSAEEAKRLLDAGSRTSSEAIDRVMSH